MKIFGIILLVIGGLNFIANLIGLGTNPEFADQQIRLLFFGIAMIGVGAYLIMRAKKKKEEEQDKDNWNNGDNL